MDVSSFSRAFHLYYTIYKTTCLLNGKFYVGKHQTRNLDDGYFGSGKLLMSAVKKYGIENFVTEVIAVYKTEKEMDLAEKILVVVDPDVSYNLCNGGRGGFSFINRQKLGVPHFSKSNAKKYSTVANKNKINKMKADLVWSEAYCQKISEGLKGKLGYWTGKQHSEQTKKKMSDLKKVQYLGAGNPNFGKKRSSETKAKIAATIRVTLAKKKLNTSIV